MKMDVESWPEEIVCIFFFFFFFNQSWNFEYAFLPLIFFLLFSFFFPHPFFKNYYYYTDLWLFNCNRKPPGNVCKVCGNLEYSIACAYDALD